MKKFIITSALVAFVAAFGAVLATAPGTRGQAPTQPGPTTLDAVKPDASHPGAAASAAPSAVEPKLDIVTADAQLGSGTPPPTPPSTAVEPAGVAPAPQSAPEADAAKASAAPGPAPAKPVLTARVPADTAPVSGTTSLGSLDPAVAPYRMTFARSGAGISEIVFADFWKSFDDRRAAQVARETNNPSQMPPDSARFVLATSTAIGQFTVPVLAAREIEIDGAKADLFGEVWGEAGPGKFRTEIVAADGRVIARVEREFKSVGGGSYQLLLEQRVTNLTQAPMKVRIVQYGPGDLPRDTGSALDIRRFHFGYLFPEKRDPTQTIVSAHEQMKDRAAVSSEIKKSNYALWPNASSTGGEFALSWFGSTDRYFAFAVHAPYAPPGSPSKKLDAIAEVRSLSNGLAGVDEQLLTSMLTPMVEVAPQSAAGFDMGVYAGPLNPRVLNHAEPFAGLNMGALIVYAMGGCCSWCTFAWLADALLWFLSFIHDYLVLDWSLAIIVLVIVVRLILHPIQKKSQIGMQRFSRAMTAMKPELDALQKKFKDDPTRMQQEQMRLFREKGVSPAGCVGSMLPMFAQMPIWMALYAVLFFAFDLRQQPAFFGFFQTFGGWAFLADLSAQDNFFRFSSPIDLWLFKLSAINLLPILMGIVFYFQQKYMSPPITPNMSEEQIQQQKIMKWMMVVMFPVMTYVAPSGLTLYIMTSTCIGIIEGRIIKRQIDAMDLTAKPVPGKKGLLSRLYEKALERAAEQQKQAGRGKPRGKDR